LKIIPCIQSIILAVVITTSIPPSVFASEQHVAIPAVLTDMEKHTQEMIGSLLAKDGATSHKYFQQIKDDVKQLHEQMEAGRFNERRSRELLMTYSWMRVIGIEMSDKSWVGAAVAANQLSAMLVQTTHFPTLTRRDVAWLYYLGREVELLTMENPEANADLLDVRLITLENTWKRVRKELIKDFRKKPLVEQGDALLKSLKQQPKQPAQIISSAKKLLTFVQQLRNSI